jgi:hypothetical protein
VDRLPRGAHPAYPRWFGGVGGKLPPFVWRQEPPPATAFEEARVAVLFCSRFNTLKQMMPNFNRQILYVSITLQMPNKYRLPSRDGLETLKEALRVL